jgi:hypothetical protein
MLSNHTPSKLSFQAYLQVLHLLCPSEHAWQEACNNSMSQPEGSPEVCNPCLMLGGA